MLKMGELEVEIRCTSDLNESRQTVLVEDQYFEKKQEFAFFKTRSPSECQVVVDVWQQ